MMPTSIKKFFTPPAALSYNPALSLWLSVDPLSDKSPNLSPYTYCANNPVRYFDPNGMEIEFASEDEQHLYNEYKATIQYHIDNDKNASPYKAIMNELTMMESAEQVFTIRIGDDIQTSLRAGELGSHTFDVLTHKVDINVGAYTKDYSQIQVLAHELKHGYQYLQGQIDFSENGLCGGILYDCTDEKEAFQRANLFSIGSNSHIDINKSIREYQLRGVPMEARSYQQLNKFQKESYDAQKAAGKYH